MRRTLTLVVAGLILLSAGAPVALAQEGGVDELWEQYPLNDPDRQDGRPAEPTQVAQPPRPPAEEDGGAGVALLLVPLGLALVGLLAYGAARHLRHLRHLRAEPAPRVATGRVFVRGFTEREGIGAFAGHLTAHMHPTPSRPEHVICVYDRDLETAVWVRLSELDDPGEATRIVAEPAAAERPSLYDDPNGDEAPATRRFEPAAASAPEPAPVAAGPVLGPAETPLRERGPRRPGSTLESRGGGLLPRSWDPRRRA